MKPIRHPVAATLLALAATAANAQFVKGNEAVNTLPDGTKSVEVPPYKRGGQTGQTKPCEAGASCHAGPWHMVETPSGLKECTEPFARPSTCRDSTYGTKKLSRLWVVRSGTAWLWCTYPAIGKGCVDMNARPPANLPTSALQ